jgi:hypothetical protein
MPDLNQQLQEVKSKENFLEKIKRIIPGYDGYVNRDNSRELDLRLRNTLAENLDNNKALLKNTVLNLSKSGKLFQTDAIDKIQNKLQEVIAKLKTAARGYTGAADTVKIKDDKLNQVYQFDAGLVDAVSAVAAVCTEMEAASAANTDISASEQKLSGLLDNFILQFDQRESILRNL